MAMGIDSQVSRMYIGRDGLRQAAQLRRSNSHLPGAFSINIKRKEECLPIHYILLPIPLLTS